MKNTLKVTIEVDVEVVNTLKKVLEKYLIGGKYS